MSEYERSRTMPDLPEHVFDQASVITWFSSWLPDEVHVRPGEPPAVAVHEDRTGLDAPALLHADRERMRLEWGALEGGSGYTGWLQVAGYDTGASEVTVHLSFSDRRHDPGEEAVLGALDRSLARLEEQVRLRVEDAG
ncbi:SRPBCC family protein [Streptomyces roseoverticillatus]|uniref:SRPBCC family protein n=1 Tax=Streptomyces roseoverticillatus TaxID=66429 RepID=UPI001F45DA7E|nr:SRPBCC family protein [Streptomyces roseoverticillatus]MCF3101497.1 SRPBCC family protein [Streptomyces roseoverticillatus]